MTPTIEDCPPHGAACPGRNRCCYSMHSDGYTERLQPRTPISDGRAFKWDDARRAAQEIIKAADDAAYVPPEVPSGHARLVGRVCVSLDAIVTALKILRPDPARAGSPRVAELEATIAALQSQLASESREVLLARCTALAAALRSALADVDPKQMSSHEQQSRRRAARALLEDA